MKIWKIVISISLMALFLGVAYIGMVLDLEKSPVPQCNWNITDHMELSKCWTARFGEPPETEWTK